MSKRSTREFRGGFEGVCLRAENIARSNAYVGFEGFEGLLAYIFGDRGFSRDTAVGFTILIIYQ